ncbi:MAG: GAF domain-containing protein, partial [Chloroflexia bacterium]
MARKVHGQASPHRWLRQVFCPVHPEELTDPERLAYQHFLTRARGFALLKGLLDGLLAVCCLVLFPQDLRPAAIFVLDGLLLLPYLRLVRRWPALSTLVLFTVGALAVTAADRFAGRPTATTDALYGLLIVAGAVLLIHPRHIVLLAGLVSFAYLLPLLGPMRVPGVRLDRAGLHTAGVHTLAFLGLGGIAGLLGHLYQQLLESRARQELLTTLLGGLQEITAPLSLPLRLQRIAERAAEVTAAVDRVFLLVEEEGRLIVRGAAGYAGVPLLGLTFPADCLRQHDKPLSLSDILGERRKNLPTEALAALDRLPPTQSSLLLPLIGREGHLGLLILSSSRQPDAFDEETRRQLGLFAQQAAIVLENVRLVNRLQQSLRELEQKAQELELRQQELWDLIATISRRLQGPVEAVSGFTRLLRDSGASHLTPE